ncbi:MAG: RecX family transcriptional regulator [Bacilli bacterium]|nr:RecX family transcriptional regulator [Bacilli bacterium]
MKITNLKKLSKGKYRLSLDNNKTITLYEDVIIKNVLLPNKDIDASLISKLDEENFYATAYNQALNYISYRLRCENEIKIYLFKKSYNELIINYVIDKLTKEGYIDDYKFAQAYFNDKINLNGFGIYKIKKELENLGINDDIISNIVSNIDENIVKDNIIKLINKQIKANHKYTGNVLKKRIINHLINLGYSYELISPYLDNIDTKEDSNFLKEYEKLYNKYSLKYKNYELKMIIKQKLYQKGYTDFDIDNLINKKE